MPNAPMSCKALERELILYGRGKGSGRMSMGMEALPRKSLHFMIVTKTQRLVSTVAYHTVNLHRAVNDDDVASDDES